MMGLSGHNSINTGRRSDGGEDLGGEFRLLYLHRHVTHCSKLEIYYLKRNGYFPTTAIN